MALLLAAVAALAVLAGVLVALAAGGDGQGASAATATSASPTPTPSPPPVWPATPARPARVWIGGDSLGGELVWGLVPLLKATATFRTGSFSKESSGICRYDYFDWRTKMTSVMKKPKPHAVVIMLGTNDTQSVWTTTGWIAYGTTTWKTAYGKRVGRLMDVTLDGGARRVYWVGMPIMRESWRNSRMRVINTVVRKQAEKRPGVRFIDIWALFTDADGRYVAKWRGGDGVHFSTAGWRRLGKRVYRSIAADWLAAASPSPAATVTGSPAP